MEPVFLDTGYLLALELASDQNHEAAARHWRQASGKLPPLVTTSYVFDEVVTFFNGRGHHGKAAQVGSSLLRSPSVDLVHVDESLFDEGWRYFLRHADKTYSLTDCVSFIVMSRRGITAAFAFDKHFTQAGFAREPQSS